MIASSKEYTQNGHLVTLLIVLSISSGLLAKDVQCNWKNDETTSLKWTASYSEDYEEELTTDTCTFNVNCKSDAVLITYPPQEEHYLKFEYFIKGDHRCKLTVESSKETYEQIVGDFVNPQEEWKAASIKISADSGELYISGHIVSSTNKIYLRGIGIQGVSRSCKSEPIRRTTTTTSTTATVAMTRSTTISTESAAMLSTGPTTASTMTTSSDTISTTLFILGTTPKAIPTTAVSSPAINVLSLTMSRSLKTVPTTLSTITASAAVPLATINTPSSSKSYPLGTTPPTASPTTKSTTTVSSTSTLITGSTKPTSTTPTTTPKTSIAGTGGLGGGQNGLENEVEERLQLQKVEVVPVLAEGFTKVVTPEICVRD